MVTVLAIEQLTGAVAAQQVALTTNASAAASASVSSGADAIDRLTKSRQDLEERLRQEETVNTKLSNDLSAKNTALNTAKAATNPATPQTELDKLEGERDATEQSLNQSQQRKANLNERIAEHTESIDALSALQDAAVTSAQAQAAGAATLAGGRTASTISDTNAQYIANAVKDIVQAYLSTPRLVEQCLEVLKSEQGSAQNSKLVQVCIDVFGTPKYEKSLGGVVVTN